MTEDDRMVANLGGMSFRQGQQITTAISQPHAQVAGMASNIGSQTSGHKQVMSVQEQNYLDIQFSDFPVSPSAPWCGDIHFRLKILTHMSWNTPDQQIPPPLSLQVSPSVCVCQYI